MLYFKVFNVICINVLYVICHLYTWMILILPHIYYLSISYTCEDNHLHSLYCVLYCTFLNTKYICLCYYSFGLEHFSQYWSKFDLYTMSKKNILHINENIIGILMPVNVCFNIRCLNSHIQRINDIISLEILAFVSFCRIVNGWTWRF